MGLSASKAAARPDGPRPRPRNQKEPLHVLARKGHYDSAQCLLSQHTKAVNKQDASGRTPLFWATEYRHENLVELLLSHGADVAARDHEGNTCLHWSANVGCARIARRLLDAGSDVNAQNDQGDSPLHLAARERRYQCLVLLLAHGAKVSLRNNAGQTPLQCARQSSPPWSAMKAFASLSPGQVERTLSRDISRGFEPVPIPCLNGVDNEPCPSNFLYITQDVLSDSVSLTTVDWVRRQCCQCTRICSAAKCPCVQRSQRTWYTPDGQLVPTSSSIAEMDHIYECHVLCSCSSFCPNRVVQRGIRYFGELISQAELEQRQEDTYHYRVDSKDGAEYYLDGNFYGSVGRFLNHSCDPNLVPVRVTVGQEIPGIAFFTTRAIQAGKELGFDYGDHYWHEKGLKTCYCKSPNCRFQSLPSLPAAGEPGQSPHRPLRGFALKSKRRNPLRMITRSSRTHQASLP